MNLQLQNNEKSFKISLSVDSQDSLEVTIATDGTGVTTSLSYSSLVARPPCSAFATYFFPHKSFEIRHNFAGWSAYSTFNTWCATLVAEYLGLTYIDVWMQGSLSLKPCVYACPSVITS